MDETAQLPGPAGAAAPRLAARLLGRPALYRGGEDLIPRLQYRKGIALLAYLAVHAGSWQGRSKLANLLWPDLDTGAARTNLRQVLNRLGGLLNAGGATVLHKDAEAIRLDPAAGLALDIDWLNAQQAAPAPGSAAEAAWCDRLEPLADGLLGEFLDGLQLADTPAFDDWLQATREHFLGRACALVERLCRVRQRQGRLDAAVAGARRLRRAAPLDEGHTLLLMTLLAEAGDSRAALAEFDILRQRLGQELGAAPGPALETLAADFRRSGSCGRGQPPELRWATALYCAPGLRADDIWHEDAAFTAEVHALIERRGGQMIPASGRGLLAAFGFGAGSERAAERAALAARDIHLGPAARYAPRTGLCAGQILFQPGSMAPRLLGELPDLAMQVGWSAAAGEILVNEAVARQASSRFAFDAAGERHFPGIAGSHAVYRLGAALQADDAARPVALAGRDAELAALQALWQEARRGRSRIALLRAPAGLGKTRLAGELAQRVAADGGRVYRIACRLEAQHQPLAPIIAAVEAFIAPLATEGGTPTERRPALRRHALAEAFPTLDQDSIDALAALPARDGGGDTLHAKSASFAAILRLLDSLAASAPTLLVVDDLHWSDHATLELIGLLAASLDRQPLLLAITTRPEVALDHPAATTVFDLSPLVAADALAVIAANDPDARIPAADRARIATACGGVPLFLERMTQGWPDADPRRLAVAELLQGELDRLGAAKPVLLAAAVLGAAFSRAQLQALLPGLDVDDALADAAARRLVTIDGDACVFSHALIRDTAYDSLPPTQRRGLHRQAAALLARQDAPAAEAVAAHFSAAASWQDAAAWWQRAGEAAMTREFAADAMRCFEQALHALEQKGTAEEDRIELRMQLGHAAQVAQGFGSALAHRLFADIARRLEEAPTARPGHRRTLFAALSGCYMGGSSQGEVDGLNIARRLESLAHTDAERLMTSFALGNSLFWRGQLDEARAWQERGIAFTARMLPRDRIRYCVDDPAITCRAFLAWNLWFLGDEAAACATAEAAVALARQGRRTHALCFALTFAVCVHWCRGAVEDVVRLADEARVLAQRHGLPLWESANSLFLLWAQAVTGTLADAAPLLDAAARMQQAYRAGITTSRWIAARALLAHGANTDAEALLDLTLREAAANEDQYCVADLLWMKAEARNAAGDAAAAESLWLAARALAASQGAVGLQRRFDAGLTSAGAAP